VARSISTSLQTGLPVVNPSSLLVCALCAVFTLALFPRSAQPMPDSTAEQSSRYQRAVRLLGDTAPDTQAAFASIAITELAEVYMAEADLARKQAGRSSERAKLLGWSRGVNQLAAQLSLVLEDIEQGYPVDMSVTNGAAASVAVAGKTVILTHPRAGQQAAFEQRILQEFCARNDCGLLTVQDAGPEPIPVSVSTVRPLWSFTDSGPVCSHQGIQVRFDGVQNVARRRGVCEQFLQEATTLANELVWQRRHGVTVEWGNLMIRPTPQRPEHLLQLNAAGDSILATMPLIYGSPDLLRHITPWLQSRLAGGAPVTVQLDATQYGWE